MSHFRFRFDKQQQCVADGAAERHVARARADAVRDRPEYGVGVESTTKTTILRWVLIVWSLVVMFVTMFAIRVVGGVRFIAPQPDSLTVRTFVCCFGLRVFNVVGLYDETIDDPFANDTTTCVTTSCQT